MKLGFTVAYIIVSVALIIFLVRAVFQKRKNAKYIKWVMGFACLSVWTSILQLVTKQEMIANLAFGLFFVSIDWLLLAIVGFCDNYCEMHIERYLKPWILIAVSAVDSVQLLLNPWLHHAYRMELVTRGKECYWVYDAMGAFQIHLLWSYVLVALMAGMLIIKTAKVPMMYRAKYRNILLILCLVVLMDALHLILGTAVDFSVLGFPLAAIAVYYYAVEFIPRALVDKTLGLAVDEMLDGVIIADAENRAIYANDCVKEMLSLDLADADHFGENFEAWCRQHYQSPDENFIYDWTCEQKNGDKKYLKVHYRRLLDEKKMYVGCYLNIQERTEEIQTLLEERYAATHDFLTGLYNRSYFYKQAERCLRLHPEERYLMICSDIRNFKMINEVFGTKVADQLLVDMAEAIRSQTIGGEVYGRLVNDRFALLMRKRDYREMKFIVKSAEFMKIANDVSYPIKIYLGVYEIDDPSIPVSMMCDRALMAVSTIKGDYQKQIAYYDENLRYHMMQEQELAAGLDRAIRDGELELYIQPQFTADGRCLGGEGLVRWNHPTRGLLLPGAFIECFERNGMIVKLDLHVWELACRLLREWKDKGFEDRYISVNISPKDFFFVDIFKEFMALVTRYGISPHNLKLEITETAIITDLPKQLALIKKLRDAGFVVEMDDFGSGYSSLNMLKDIRVDMLKIDMEFLRQSENEGRSRTILKTVVALSKELGMPVITEGVETKDHVDFLTQIGCDIFQGFFFARPMKVADYEEKYLSQAKE
ncbi:MAG: EAL domain-containing protein [bacterium]|nr:EAL domain-containing protein [bacterium]MDY4099856.1 EAL domain-containing protein [Lachnospiraceae bacterium]